MDRSMDLLLAVALGFMIVATEKHPPINSSNMHMARQDTLLQENSSSISYHVAFSTYVGGKKWEHARDVCCDNEGNVYMVGGTASDDFPTTAGAFDTSFDGTGDLAGESGPCDVFVAKFSPRGKLLWSTLLGGPHYDRAYAVEIGPEGNIFLAGRAGPGFPVSKNAFQPKFAGIAYIPFYGDQNGFVAKLSPDGKKLLWASYVGVGALCRDLAVDAQGDVYVPMGRYSKTKRMRRPRALTDQEKSQRITTPSWFSTAFSNAHQKTPSGPICTGAAKIKGDGTKVLWATWLGGSGKDSQEASLRLNKKNQVCLAFNTTSNDLPSAQKRKYQGKTDGYVALLETDGSKLIYGTYLGGKENDWVTGTHNLAMDRQGNAIVTLDTGSADFPVTKGAYQTKHAGEHDVAVVKVSPTGAILHSTFLGGKSNDNFDGTNVDARGRVICSGETASSNFPTTEGAIQSKWAGKRDAVLVVLSPSLDRLEYSTYLGGPSRDNGRSSCLAPDGSVYLTGAADGPGFPTTAKAFQPRFAGGAGRWGNGDCLLVRFAPGKHQNNLTDK